MSPLDGMRPPRPPAALRARVLAAALAAQAERDGWIDRAWESRPLWWALGAAYVVAVAINFWISGGATVAGAAARAAAPVVVDGLALPAAAEEHADASAFDAALDLPGRS